MIKGTQTDFSLAIDRMKKEDVETVWHISQTSQALTNWSRSSFEQECQLALSTFFVARAPGIIGYGGFWHMGEEAHIVHLAVEPSFRRKGVGSELLKNLLTAALAKGLYSVTLEVHATNTAACALYEKFGFKQVGMRPRYYGEHDALLLRKSLCI